jgi:hypothetical protein
MMFQKNRHAGPVNCIRLILIMVSIGMGRGLSQGYTAQGRDLGLTWDFQEGRTFQPRCGLRPRTMPKETVMRFYNQAHEFYCGVDLHARTMYLCILDHANQVDCLFEAPAEGTR